LVSLLTVLSSFATAEELIKTCDFVVKVPAIH
jgi:hypothetical protein